MKYLSIFNDETNMAAVNCSNINGTQKSNRIYSFVLQARETCGVISATTLEKSNRFNLKRPNRQYSATNRDAGCLQCCLFLSNCPR